MTSILLTQLLIMAFCIIMSAFFSATETAFSSLNRTRLKTIAEKGNKRAILACRLEAQYDNLLSTILIGNNIVNIATASIGTVIFVNIYGDMGATISTIVVTVVVLIFGEITPKSIAKDCPEKFAIFSAPFLNLFLKILKPLNYLFSLWKKLISKVLKLESDTRMSQEELLMLVDEKQQDGSIDRSEGDLLRNAIEFTELEAEDILTHRVDLEAVPVDATKEEISRVFSETKFSRIPVYEENIDNIIGIIHLKDFYTEAGITGQNIRDIVAPAIFVLQSEKISTILKKLQKKKTHVAVVVDEYGGTYGIVTMEDILEELVGEIWDEHDEVNEFFQKLAAGTWKVDAMVDMDDFCEFFHIKTETDATSLGGWVMEQFGQIPNTGDQFDCQGLRIKILSTDHHRVAETEVRRIPAEPGAPDEKVS